MRIGGGVRVRFGLRVFFDHGGHIAQKAGQRYRVTTCRPSSLPRLPDDTRQAVMRQDVPRLLRKGNQAKLRDFAALKSGRDAYSRLHYQELIARLSEADAILIIASDLPEEDQASACR